MWSGVRLYLVGSLILLAAGCSQMGFEEREPWRHEAEVACLKSGAVKEGAGIAQLRPIAGPGKCGADFPLKVAALGQGSALGFAEQLRPPGTIPAYSPRPYPREIAPGPAPAAAQQMEPYPGPEPDGDFDDSAEPPPSTGQQPYPPSAYPPSARTPEPLPLLGRPPAVSTTAIQPAATLACPMVSVLDRWMADVMQPAAQRWFGQPVVEIKQISAYSCRGMNGNRHARISEHAFGNALDVAAFTFADGRKITVKNGWRGAAEERGFLHEVAAGACDMFNTVLGPGSNVYHYDHLHFDLMRRSNDHRICNPDMRGGDRVAGRGSRPLGFAPNPNDHLPFDEVVGERLPDAIPGAD